MQIENKTQLREESNWLFRVSQQEKSPSHVLLLLHGWTGDENSMWTFTRNFPSDYAILAPRAPYPALAEKGGFSWREIKPGTWGAPTLDELHFAADSLVSLVDFWLDSAKMASLTFDIVGFSQGGALAATIATLYPKRVEKVAVLSGFIPPGVDVLLQPDLLKKKRFFWAHGTKDEMISFERGRAGIELLQNAGAEVTLCQADIGHKVSKDCRRALDIFLNTDS